MAKHSKIELPTSKSVIRSTLHVMSIFVLFMNNPLASAQTFFRIPPTDVTIHNPTSTEGQRNRTTISIVVPENAGANLKRVVLSQLTNIDQWDWGRKDPNVYLGKYQLRGRGESGLADSMISNNGEDLAIHFDPAIEPGQQVNVVFSGNNPDSSIYQWASTFYPEGVDAVSSDGPTLRVAIYKSSDYR